MGMTCILALVSGLSDPVISKLYCNVITSSMKMYEFQDNCFKSHLHADNRQFQGCQMLALFISERECAEKDCKMYR